MYNHQLVTAIMLFSAKRPDLIITSIKFIDDDENRFEIETFGMRFFMCVRNGVIHKMGNSDIIKD